jgi:hypothetical protein
LPRDLQLDAEICGNRRQPAERRAECEEPERVGWEPPCGRDRDEEERALARCL